MSWVCKILSKYTKRFKRYDQVHFFSVFEPRQNLDQSQVTFDNLLGHILSISICMQNFITIFHSVQETGPIIIFFFFRIWFSAKPRPMINAINQSLGLDLVNINTYAKFHHSIPLSSRGRAIFTLRIWRSAKPR